MKKENGGGKEGKRVGRREKERGKKESFAATLEPGPRRKQRCL